MPPYGPSPVEAGYPRQSYFVPRGEVVLLMHFDTANSQDFIDQKGHVFAVFDGDPTISSAAPKFGAGALNLPALGGVNRSRITTPDATDLRLGARDLTVEGFIKFQTAGVIYGGQIEKSGEFAVYFDADRLVCQLNGGNIIVSAALGAADNVWYHYAMSRRAATLYGAFNGAIVGTGAAQDIVGGAGGLFIGNVNHLANVVTQQDEIRITSRLGRYTAAYTPPAAPFQG